MTRKRRKAPNYFGDYESFAYFLTELELLVEAGTIQWSEATAQATQLRLRELATRLQKVIAQLDEEEGTVQS
jgi:hypothetical protein